MTRKEFSEIDLSKCPYIYRIYRAADDRAHIEKYPVIYANSFAIYYKTSAKNYLDCINTSRVISDISKINLNNYSYYRSEFFLWNQDGINPEDAESIFKEFKRASNNLRLKTLEDTAEKRRRYYEETCKELERIKKEMED